ISRSGSVRSEQRSLAEKDLPPSGLRRIWPVASLLVGYSPMAGMRPPRASPQAKLGATNVIVLMPQTTKVCRFKTWLLNQTSWRIKDQLKKRKAGQASRQSGAGGTPALRSDDTARTATIERVPDPAASNLDA